MVIRDQARSDALDDGTTPGRGTERVVVLISIPRLGAGPVDIYRLLEVTISTACRLCINIPIAFLVPKIFKGIRSSVVELEANRTAILFSVCTKIASRKLMMGGAVHSGVLYLFWAE